MSQACPFCPDEPDETPSGWGMSPEGWRMAKENHDKYHTIKCSCCGQPIGIKDEEEPKPKN